MKETRLAKVWVLDTETKGTGAQMVPLDRVLEKRASGAVPSFGFRKPQTPPAAEPGPKAPLKFKVVDVMSRQVLAESVDARAAVRALEAVRSVVDVNVYVWNAEQGRWRKLTFGETRGLWEYRGRGEEMDGRASSGPPEAVPA
jgi:hypothetical protein